MRVPPKISDRACGDEKPAGAVESPLIPEEESASARGPRSRCRVLDALDTTLAPRVNWPDAARRELIEAAGRGGSPERRVRSRSRRRPAARAAREAALPTS